MNGRPESSVNSTLTESIVTVISFAGCANAVTEVNTIINIKLIVKITFFIPNSS